MAKWSTPGYDDNGSDELAITNEVQMHEAIRQSVQENIDRNIECIRQKMLGRGGIVVQSFSVGDVVRLRIPGTDRTRLGRKFLPCRC